MLLTVPNFVNSVAQFFTVLVLFVFVLGITYITTRYIAGYQKTKISTGNMEIVETLRISSNKYLQIVRVGEKYLVMAVCKDTVTLLCELTEEQLELNRSAGPQDPAIDFKALLEKARQKHHGAQSEGSEEEK